MRKRSLSEVGFTLTEIIVVLVIVGILVTLAVSQFGPGRERAMGKEASANLKLMAAAQKIYRIENSFYYPYSASTFTDLSNINTNLKLFLSEKNWDYSVAGTAAGTSFTAIANRQDTAGGTYKDCEYSLNNANIDGEPSKSAQCP